MAFTKGFASKEEASQAYNEVLEKLGKNRVSKMRELYEDLPTRDEDEFIEEFIEKVEEQLGKAIIHGVHTYISTRIRNHFER